MICRNCGRELPDDARFCGRCGAPVSPAAPAAGSSAPASENAAPAAGSGAPASENAAPAAGSTGAAQGGAAGTSAAASEQTGPAAARPQPQVPPPLSDSAPSWSSRPAPSPAPVPRQQSAAPLSVGQFFLMDLVSMIPLLNIVLLLVWSFADNTNPNRRNLARARLIWVAIGIVCSILLLLIAIWAMSNTYWYLRY